MQPTYVTKALTIASTNGIGSVSTAVPSVVTLNTSALDTGRRIVFYSTADASTMTFTIKGIGDGGSATVTETVLGATASGLAATTTSDFYQLTSVTISTNANIPFLIGTSSVGGTPWKLVDWTRNPPIIGGSITFTTSSNSMSAAIEVTTEDPTGTFPSSRLVPVVLRTTSPLVGASTTSYGIANVAAAGTFPIAAWRMTFVSSAITAGSAMAAITQSG